MCGRSTQKLCVYAHQSEENAKTQGFCINQDFTHRELALNWTLAEELELPHWPRLQDRVMVYRRNATRRAHVERDRCFECQRYIPTGAIGRCDACFRRRPPALALKVGRHRIEYPESVVQAMPAALRKAFESSAARIR
jgi:hypothetical protein